MGDQRSPSSPKFLVFPPGQVVEGVPCQPLVHRGCPRLALGFWLWSRFWFRLLFWGRLGWFRRRWLRRRWLRLRGRWLSLDHLSLSWLCILSTGRSALLLDFDRGSIYRRLSWWFSLAVQLALGFQPPFFILFPKQSSTDVSSVFDRQSEAHP